MTGEIEHTGERFGPFRVFERLGKGGSASVWRARRQCDDGSELEVSLKRLHPHLADDTDAVRRFLNEGEIASVLRHDNICRFYEMGRHGDQLFISMEYLDGVDLRRLLQEAHDAERPPPFAVTLSLLCQLCDALEYAHTVSDDATGVALDLVHRDISPSNLVITTDGRLKLIDLGIAKTRTTAIQTKTGLIRGKFGYMAPEVLRGKRANQRSDIYSVGVVAWELLTAKRLFGRTSDVETMERIRAGAKEPPSLYNPACAPQLDAVVMRALDRDPARRWPSAASMRTALQAVSAALHEPIAPEVVRSWLRQSRSIPLPAPASESGATTDTHTVDEPTRPSGVRRFATGSRQMEAVTPQPHTIDPSGSIDSSGSISDTSLVGQTVQISQMAEWTRGRLAEEAAKRRVLVWIMSASLLLNLILLVAVFTGQGRQRTAAPAAPAPQTSEPVLQAAGVKRDRRAAPRPAPAMPTPTARALRPAAPPAPAPTPPGVATRDEDASIGDAGLDDDAELAELTISPPVLFARFPRSRSTRAFYTARLCIDRRGKVESVTVKSGPERLYPRIRRYLRLWRFAPHRVLGESMRACFDVRHRLRAAR